MTKEEADEFLAMNYFRQRRNENRAELRAKVKQWMEE